ncbi:MAG: hypothetical protein ACRERD_02730 [Candidatus Binatia bacterium]
MKCAFTWKVIVGLVLAALIWEGLAKAEEQFHTLAGVPTEAMSSGELAAVEGKVTNQKFFDFTPRFFDLDSLLDPQRGLLKGTFTPAGEFRLPFSAGGPHLSLKGALNDAFQLTGPFDSQGRLNLNYREALDKGFGELRLSGLPDLLELDSGITSRDHLAQFSGVLDPERGLRLFLKDMSNDSGRLRLSGLLGLVNLDAKGGIGDGEIQPLDLRFDPRAGLSLNVQGAFQPSGELQLSSLPGIMDLTFKGAGDDSGELQLSGLLGSEGRPHFTFQGIPNDGGELQISGLLGLLNLNLRGFGNDNYRFALFDPKGGLTPSLTGGSDELGELRLSSVSGPKRGPGLLHIKGTSKENLPFIGVLRPGGLTLNVLGLSLPGRR